MSAFSLVTASSAPLYSIGDPTDDEQLYVELINRARANPRAEAARFRQTQDPVLLGAYSQFGVDLGLMESQFAAFNPVPPVSINRQLTDSARAHSADMLATQRQSHSGSDGSTPLSRVQKQGYTPVTVAENIYAFAESVEAGHAGFQVDWGDLNAIGIGGVLAIIGGMQTPAGHRANIHNGTYREIGVGVINTPKGAVGPQLVTEDFATPTGAKPFITGVAFFDLNGNQFYDLGEGIGGIPVQVSNATFSAITARSGGYSVPVAGNGTYTVTFSFPGAAPVSKTVSITNSENVKVDLIQAYSPPALTGSTAPAIGAPNPYQISPVYGATSYQWSVAQAGTATPVGAEDNGTSVQSFISRTYPLIVNNVKAVGNSSYHLAHEEPLPQSFVLNDTFLVKPQAALQFQSRLGGAASDEFAKVQVSKDGGATWSTVYNQQGTDSFGESTFRAKSIDLSAFNGSRVKVRFLFDFDQGNFGASADEDFGWYVDDIQFVNMDKIVNETVSTVSANAFNFAPVDQTPQILRARPVNQDRLFDWGPSLFVQPTVAQTTTANIRKLAATATGDLQLDFDLLSGILSNVAVESAPTVRGPWTTQSSGAAQLISGATHRFTFKSPAAPATFFRLRSN